MDLKIFVTQRPIYVLDKSEKTYKILVTNALFSVINYFLQLLTNKIFINTIMFFKLYNLQSIYSLKM